MSSIRTLWFVGFLIVLLQSVASAADILSTDSPDLSVRFWLSSEARFQVTLHGKPVVEWSPLQITIDGADIATGENNGKTISLMVREEYAWRGVKSRAVNNSLNTLVPLKHLASNTDYTLEFRVFNDGVAFRHLIPVKKGEGADRPRIPDEATKFIIPAGATVWHHDLGGHYEDTYEKTTIENIPAEQWLAPPVTYRLASGEFASITEAALVNYSGMALQADGQRGLTIGLGHKHPISYPFELRYKDDIERVKQPAAVTGSIISPWRVVIVGKDLNALVNSDVVHNLCPPPDEKLFPSGMKTDWIKPGRAVWRYLDGGRNTLEDMKEFSRMAGELGFEYHVVEGFWSRWSDEQIKEFVDYSRERGVGLWFWRHSRALRTPEARTEFFARLQKLGVVGAKIDFFDHEHREVVDLYPALLEEAAKHKIMVNFHGSNKPTGDPRTWPNELIREGVRGMESSRLRERARHNATLPFTRFLAGHADYTPVHFGDRRADTTWAHQIATAVVFTEPLLTYGAHPKTILANPAVEMIKSIPATWDETIVLPVSEIGEVAAFGAAAATHGSWQSATGRPRDSSACLSRSLAMAITEHRSLAMTKPTRRRSNSTNEWPIRAILWRSTCPPAAAMSRGSTNDGYPDFGQPRPAHN